jgi:uncharacterized membrane protein
MRDSDNESGQSLIFVALSMAVLMGFMALAIDVGVLFRARRNMQIAADSAATAAALNYLYYGSVPSAKAAAIAAAAANGVTITNNDINTPLRVAQTPQQQQVLFLRCSPTSRWERFSWESSHIPVASQ